MTEWVGNREREWGTDRPRYLDAMAPEWPDEPPPPDGPDPWTDGGEPDPDWPWLRAPIWRRVVTVELPEEDVS